MIFVLSDTLIIKDDLNGKRGLGNSSLGAWWGVTDLGNSKNNCEKLIDLRKLHRLVIASSCWSTEFAIRQAWPPLKVMSAGFNICLLNGHNERILRSASQQTNVWWSVFFLHLAFASLLGSAEFQSGKCWSCCGLHYMVLIYLLTGYSAPTTPSFAVTWNAFQLPLRLLHVFLLWILEK